VTVVLANRVLSVWKGAGWLCVIMWASSVPWVIETVCPEPASPSGRQQRHHAADRACSPARLHCLLCGQWFIVAAESSSLFIITDATGGNATTPSMLALWCRPQLPEEVTPAPTCLLPQTLAAASLEWDLISYRDGTSDPIWQPITNQLRNDTSVQPQNCNLVMTNTFIHRSLWRTKHRESWATTCPLTHSHPFLLPCVPASQSN